MTTNIGSICCHVKYNNYTLTPNNNNNNISYINNNNLFDIFIESIQLPFKNKFYANSVYSLSDFITNKSNTFSLYNAEKMIRTIYHQIIILNKYHISISYLTLDDIMVINDSLFFICNFDRFCLYNSYNKIHITDIYDKKNPYLSPLLINNSSIPLIASKNEFLYNLALIIIHCLRISNNNFNEESLDDILNYYKNTKLHNTLSYCLKENVSKRQFIIF